MIDVCIAIAAGKMEQQPLYSCIIHPGLLL